MRQQTDEEQDKAIAVQLPVWIRAIALVGIPGAIAFFLVWVGARDIPHMSVQVDAIQEAVLQNRELIKDMSTRYDAQFRMLQRICSNTAKSDAERARCFD